MALEFGQRNLALAVADHDDAHRTVAKAQFLHDVGQTRAVERAMISVHMEDGMVPPHDWDKLVIASGVTLIDSENIKEILAAKKP